MGSHGRFLLAASLALLVLATIPAFAAVPFAINETILAPDGTSLTRSVTMATTTPATAPDIASPGPAGSRDANTYLWLDRNHLNAVAENVNICGTGMIGVVGWWLNNMRFAVYRVPGGSGTPQWTRPMPAAQFQIPVDADDLADRLVTTARGESLYVFDAADPDPLFSNWFNAPLVGYKVGVSDFGNTIVGCGGNPAGGEGEVRVFDGATYALRFKKPLPAPPEGACVSGDGLVVAANVRGFVKIWDAMTGAQRDSVAIAGETQTPAVLSADGSYLVTGGFNKTVKLYHWDGAHYTLVWSHNIPGTTWVTALAISRNGSTIAAGTWTNGSQMGGKLVAYDRSSSTPLWTDSGFGDEVASVALTEDGAMIAAGCWGRSGGTYGNVISVYLRGSSVPVSTIGDDAVAGVGSCMSVDLSRDGHFLLAGGKAVHAREYGSGGWVMAIQVANPADVAGNLGTPASRRIEAGPNPFRGSLRITAPGNVRIVSADGRVIRRGLGSMWDGRDDAGRVVPAGTYFIRGEAPGAGALRIVRIR